MAEQKMRFTDSELAIIKAVFADREDLLKLLRKIFQLVNLTEKEQEIVKKTFTPEAIKVIKKSFLPNVDLDAPINQIVDLWMTVNITDKEPHQAAIALRGRAKIIELLEMGVKRFEDPSGIYKSVQEFSLQAKSNATIDKDIENLIARNTLISHIEQQLYQIKVLAGQKEETVEETKERLLKNSSK